MEKKCIKCQTIKSAEGFRNSKQNKDGLFSMCRECQNAYVHEKYVNNKELRKQQIKAWQRKRRGKIRDYQKKYRALKKTAHLEIVTNISSQTAK